MQFLVLLSVVAMLASSMTEGAYVPQAALYRRRFGQEDPAVLNDIRALNNLPSIAKNGLQGQFDTIAGDTIGTLLAGADPCALLDKADQIAGIAKQVGGDDAKKMIQVAQKLLHSEKNFDPTGAAPHPKFCNNAAKPATQQLRCILPLVDPSSGGAQKQGGGISAADANQKTGAILAQALAGTLNQQACAGQSIQQQMQALGFTDCIGCAAAGKATPPPAAAPPASNNAQGNAQKDDGKRKYIGKNLNKDANKDAKKDSKKDDKKDDKKNKDKKNKDKKNKDKKHGKKNGKKNGKKHAKKHDKKHDKQGAKKNAGKSDNNA